MREHQLGHSSVPFPILPTDFAMHLILFFFSSFPLFLFSSVPLFPLGVEYLSFISLAEVSGSTKKYVHAPRKRLQQGREFTIRKTRMVGGQVE